MNDKKRGQLKDRLQRQFPLVPAGFLDAVLDAVAAGFTRVAPATLKRALTPGGMDQVRPVLKQSMVDAVRDQPAFRDLPVLSEKDKIRLMEVAIDLALDQALRDSEWISVHAAGALGGARKRSAGNPHDRTELDAARLVPVPSTPAAVRAPRGGGVLLSVRRARARRILPGGPTSPGRGSGGMRQNAGPRRRYSGPGGRRPVAAWRA